jgi:3-oxoacyl-[acyl-carrier-protein] synthase-3
MPDVYITSTGSFFPNAPVPNDDMEAFLGKINGQSSRVKDRILKQNGIESRHYALDKGQNTTHSNAELAINAIKDALENSTVSEKSVQLLATGTTQGDLPIPGFASMVHAGLNIDKCALASFQSVCASGVMALKDAYSQIKSDQVKTAICAGSDLASRMFKSSRFEGQEIESLSFNAEFLRWMLSDGAGAFLLQDQPGTKGLSLKIEWVDLRSHANQLPVCMYTGKTNNRNEQEQSWLDYPNYESASRAGAINLQQDVRLLDNVIKLGVAHYFDLIDQGKIIPDSVDWLCCHYSSEKFKGPIKDLIEKGGGDIPYEKWFSNLTTKGNTGAASIFIMLDELFHSGKLKAGQKILCMVPESGRFISSFFLLTVTEQLKAQTKAFEARKVEAPELVINENALSNQLVRILAQVWVDFETGLSKVPIIKKMQSGLLTLEDYKLLLTDLRQQVIDGSQWITRAASNIEINLFELRSAFIKHAATEHKDFQFLERNFVALGEDLQNIQNKPQNIGSLALSSFIFQQASKPNPVDLLGAMFIIEGIGKRLAGYWGTLIKEQLDLADNQVSFFTYHGVADEDHFHNLEKALNHPAMNQQIADNIVKTAKTTARLYKMQLEELGNY